MSRLKIRTTVTFVATSYVDGDALTPRDIRAIKKEVREMVGEWGTHEYIADAVSRVTWGNTTARKPTVVVEEDVRAR